MKQVKLINFENVPDEEAEEYSVREAARAVVFDKDGLIAMLHGTKNDYYKLPGGGIEKGETKEEALKRECREEIGCNVEIIKEVGFTVEYRKKFATKQTSYCYIAKVVGEKGEPHLEPDEIEEGFETVWLSIEEAMSKVKVSHHSLPYQGSYVIVRDFALLEAANKTK